MILFVTDASTQDFPVPNSDDKKKEQWQYFCKSQIYVNSYKKNILCIT